jgi:hypothetical protein
MEYKRLTNEELNDFTSRVVVQLEPALTQQVMSLILELNEYRTKIENGTLVELGYHIRKSYKNHDDQRYKIILIDEVKIDKIGYDCLTKAEAEAKLKELKDE